MDAQQELFTALLEVLKAHFEPLGYKVYDGFMPPDGTKYPFIYLGDMTQHDSNTKTQVIGDVSPTIHFWHNNPQQRGTLSAIMADAKALIRSIEHTKNYAWMPKITTQRIFADNTTKTPLLHGIIGVTATYS